MAVFRDRMRQATRLAEEYREVARRDGWTDGARHCYNFWCNQRDTMKGVIATLKNLPLGSTKR